MHVPSTVSVKILLFSIFIIAAMILVLASHGVKAMPYLPPQELYKQSDMVIYGQVIARGDGPAPDYYYYQIKVQNYFKNPQGSDSITAAGHKPDDNTGLILYPQFDVGDKAVFYINKVNGINTISIYSVKAGGACDVNGFLGSVQSPSHPIIGPAPGDLIYIEDSNGKMPYTPVTYRTAVFHDDEVWNNYPQPRIVPVTLSIRDGGGQQVFNQTQSVELAACSGPGKVEWDWIPTQAAYYTATVTDYKYKVSMGFNTISSTAAGSKIISPLEQVRAGIATKDVTCKMSLQLVIKAEDGSPACVKPDTAQKLIERGWGNMLTPTAWFRYTILNPSASGSNAPQDVPWSNYIPANVSDTAYKPWINGTAIKEYFTSHGVTLLEVRYSSYLLAGPEGVGTTPQRQTDFYFLTLQNDIQMNQFGFKMINVDPKQDLSVLGQILPLNN